MFHLFALVWYISLWIQLHTIAIFHAVQTHDSSYLTVVMRCAHESSQLYSCTRLVRHLSPQVQSPAASTEAQRHRGTCD